VIEFDDRDAEPRFNAIGLVDGRMLFVTYAMREAVVRIISARGQSRMKKGGLQGIEWAILRGHSGGSCCGEGLS
jgi:Ribonuclease toxin, BrnT, of type II toxin-antitoxin system